MKFIAPLPGSRHKYYQFTAIDDCTRIRALRVYDRCNQPRRSDSSTRSWRGCPSRSRRSRRTKEPSSSQGSTTTCSTGAIGHVYIRPATPRLNGKVERSHRIDADDFYRLLEGVVMDDNGLFKDRLREWENFFNFDRPHGGLGGQTPR